MATGDAKKLRRRIRYIMREYHYISDLSEKLEALIPLTHRTRCKKASPAKATRKSHMSHSDAEIIEMIHFVLDHPEMSHRKVGTRFGDDGGRLSEYLGSIRSKRLDRLRDEVAIARTGEPWRY